MVTGNTPSANLFDFTQQIDQTANRTFGTVYQNTTGKAMLVVISGTITTTNQNGVAFTDTNNPPTTQITTIGSHSQGLDAEFSMSFIVLSGNYYKVDKTTANLLVLNLWIEYT